MRGTGSTPIRESPTPRFFVVTVRCSKANADVLHWQRRRQAKANEQRIQIRTHIDEATAGAEDAGCRSDTRFADSAQSNYRGFS